MPEFRNRVGVFQIPSDPNQGWGSGYITSWKRPDGRVMSVACPGGTQAAANYLNSPGERPSGIGALGMYLIEGQPGLPGLRYWDSSWPDSDKPASISVTAGNRRDDKYGVTHAYPAVVSAQEYRQRLEIYGGRIVLEVYWRFPENDVRFDAQVTFHPFPEGTFVKEPSFGFHLGASSNIKSISTPGTPCPTYDGLTDPRRRTGRCEHPDRKTVRLDGGTPVRVRVWDQEWRRLANAAKTWPRAGNETLPWRKGEQIHDNWEYPACANRLKATVHRLNYTSLVCLFKGWEGGVTGLDFSYAFRRPLGSSSYRFGMSFR